MICDLVFLCSLCPTGAAWQEKWKICKEENSTNLKKNVGGAVSLELTALHYPQLTRMWNCLFGFFFTNSPKLIPKVLYLPFWAVPFYRTLRFQRFQLLNQFQIFHHVPKEKKIKSYFKVDFLLPAMESLELSSSKAPFSDFLKRVAGCSPTNPIPKKMGTHRGVGGQVRVPFPALEISSPVPPEGAHASSLGKFCKKPNNFSFLRGGSAAEQRGNSDREEMDKSCRMSFVLTKGFDPFAAWRVWRS